MRTLKDRAFRCTKKRDSVEVDAAVGASWIGLGWRPREIGKPKRFWKRFSALWVWAEKMGSPGVSFEPTLLINHCDVEH